MELTKEIRAERVFLSGTIVKKLDLLEGLLRKNGLYGQLCCVVPMDDPDGREGVLFSEYLTRAKGEERVLSPSKLGISLSEEERSVLVEFPELKERWEQLTIDLLKYSVEKSLPALREDRENCESFNFFGHELLDNDFLDWFREVAGDVFSQIVLEAHETLRFSDKKGQNVLRVTEELKNEGVTFALDDFLDGVPAEQFALFIRKEVLDLFDVIKITLQSEPWSDAEALPDLLRRILEIKQEVVLVLEQHEVNCEGRESFMKALTVVQKEFSERVVSVYCQVYGGL